MLLDKLKLKKIKGDASFRYFFRKKDNNTSSIIVYAKKNKKLNLLVYDAINKILIKNDILAPRLINENYSKGFIEIQDFGNQTIFYFLKRNKKNKLLIFKKIINLLNKIQLIKNKKTINFKKQNYIIPKYSSKILLEEAKLFSNWYAPQKIPQANQSKFKKDYEKVIKILIKKISLKNDVFVHRDFHVSNLMLINSKIGVIDTQDALIGNKAYDLASLIDDVRFKTSNILKEKIFAIYLKSHKRLSVKKFRDDFEIISVLRSLKIIGIFTRLAMRDNKKNYIKLIPYTWSLIRLRSKNNKIFKELNSLVDKNFTKKQLT
ncbi:phosphotransferase [Candidatus Pelagibacter sp.]|nr:phosphotransferase [Candidatus Pelagibacter sp.]